MKNIENTIYNLIEKLVIKKYPVIESIDDIHDVLRDLEDPYGVLRNKHFVVYLITSECLESSDMELIDTEIKNLFRILTTDRWNRITKPSIKTFFKCDDGLGFRFIGSYGYNH